MKQKIWYTYDDIHRVIKALAEKSGTPASNTMP
ncbi:putative phosphoribosyltransferase [Neisseria gonorrhoeae]|uniref:Putative phosphoribosyltransferase n=1 Tax=Neisseria gonorrhoeae TaxID=485 RepID=A0A378W1V0_NEIGO|nr:putative phosphoribosyltransferase [Neisseria gonorrhoeae]